MREYFATLALPKRKESDYSKMFERKYRYKRSVVLVKGAKRDGMLFIEVRAMDPTALRASINSLLRDIQVIEAVEKIAKER